MDTALKRHEHLHNSPSPTRHETLANVDNNGEDRISNLPESILCHILSKLPTKFAASTTILSTKWNNLFASIPNPTIDIDDSLLLNPHDNTTNSNFINFMNHLFTVTLMDVPTIHKLHLQCHHDYGYSNIGEWVSIALNRNVTGLSLFFNVKSTGVSIPGLFDSTTLVDLLLSQHYGLNVTDSVFFCRNLSTFIWIMLDLSMENRSRGLLMNALFLKNCLWMVLNLRRLNFFVSLRVRLGFYWCTIATNLSFTRSNLSLSTEVSIVQNKIRRC
ncbi:F-box/LRR-repeat protein At4g14096-like [Camellia sinensis]|uniref:F-box/LRR-repeat protein At4g14096-like n=1 Tax=Camellia sinensis TaxID=4442 RepID=UPI0010358D84|nr:F-box/LRR-repeat protein At4g14096-like [Camellia sinensis]